MQVLKKYILNAEILYPSQRSPSVDVLEIFLISLPQQLRENMLEGKLPECS